MVNLLAKYKSAAERYELEECNLQHETILTPNAKFNPHSMNQVYAPECPFQVQLKRPACAHCGQQQKRMNAEDYILLLIDELMDNYYSQISYALLFEKRREYAADKVDLPIIDEGIRSAKIRAKGENINATLAEIDADEEVQSYILKHRAIVSRMRTLRDFLVTEANKILAGQAKVEKHVVASSS